MIKSRLTQSHLTDWFRLRHRVPQDSIYLMYFHVIPGFMIDLSCYVDDNTPYSVGKNQYELGKK